MPRFAELGGRTAQGWKVPDAMPTVNDNNQPEVAFAAVAVICCMAFAPKASLRSGSKMDSWLAGLV